MIPCCVRNLEHKKSVNSCLNSIIKYNPSNKAIAVIDFTSDKNLIEELKTEYKNNICIIFEDTLENVPADMLCLKYFKQNKYFDIAILLQDSMYLLNTFKNISTGTIEYMWHFTNHRVHWSSIREPETDFNRENGIITHDDLIKYCVNNLIEVEGFKNYCNEIYDQKHRWSGCFACTSIINYDFLCELDDNTKIINLMSKMTTNRLRRAIESLFALACQYTLKKEIHTSFDGLYYDGFIHNNFKGHYIMKKSFDRQ